ncbi:MAG: maleylpyruvate isomerase family mycothiol-dependent enzyme [Marmoricola sp.]
MDADAIYAAAAANRRAMADLLEGLTPEQLTRQSLCGDWDVATVGAHLASAITTRLPVFMVELVRNRGSFDRANSATAIKEARHGVPATIAKIRANAESRFTPPIVGPRAPMTDAIIHTGDIARPLGLPHDAPPDHVRVALEFLGSPRPIGFVRPGWHAGLAFVALDLDLRIGDGEELRGRGVDLAMAMCGRRQALGTLAGPGVDILRARLK